MKGRPSAVHLLKNLQCVIQHALVIAFFTWLPVHAAMAATYYVAPTGSDTNDGTSLFSPLKTVAKAMSRAVAGDTVLLRGGTYREQVDVTVGGGAAGAYVTVSAYNGEVPVIKGSDIVTGWTQHSGGIWKKTGWTINSQQVFVDFDARPGPPLQQIGMPSRFYTTFEYNAAVGTGLDSMTAGTFYYDPVATTLYVWLADGSDPNTHVMEVSTKRRLFFMAKPYIHLKGVSFRHTNVSGVAQQGTAVELSSNSIIENCDIQWTDFGGLGMGYLANNTLAINNNVSNNGDSGINAPGTSSFRMVGNKMNNNNYRNFNPLWHAGGFKAAAKAYGIVEFNEAAFNRGSGIWFDYANSGGQIIIRNNYIHDNGPKEAAIFFEVSTNGLIYNNLIVNNARRGIYLAASDNTQVYNNTIVNTGGYAGLELNGMPRGTATLTNNTVYNNIITGSTGLYDVFVAAPNGTTIVNNKLNYNNIYRGGLALKLSSSTYSTTLAAWRTATGYDINSISADPAFVGSGTAAGYAVTDASPVIDAGTDVSAVLTTDYLKGARPLGLAFDMGAFESATTGTPTSTTTTTTTPTTTTTTTPTTTTTTTTTSTKDTTAPVVTIPPTPLTLLDGSVKLSATATDNVGVVLMNLYVDGTKVASSTTGSISYVWDLTNVKSGTHTIYVSASDAANNVGKASSTFAVSDTTTTTSTPTTTTTTTTTTTDPTPTTTTPTTTTTTSADTTPPIVSIGAPTDGSRVTGTVTISASATDNTAVARMQIYVDGVLKAQTSSGSVSYSWNTDALKVGNHAIRVTASDAANNTGSANATVTVKKH